MKKLEDYLHLYIGCQILDLYSERIGKLHGVNMGTVEPVQVLHKSLWGLQFTEVKPILRRLSSMTEEEQNEVWHMEEPIGILEMQASSKVRKVVICPDRMKYLLSKGFDLFGLIDVGLAIDAATLEIESHGKA